MKQATIYIFLSFIIFSCAEKEKEKKTSLKNKITSVFKKKIPVEYSDSLRVEKFLTEYPDFKPYRKKLHKFYSRRNYQLAWSKEGDFLPQAAMFINLMNTMHAHGLESYKNYHLKERYKEVTEVRRPSNEQVSLMREELDLLLSASYFKYSRDIWRGTVNPREENLEWHIARKKVKYGKTLDAILSNNESSNPFHELKPLHPEYDKLKALLSDYKKIEEQGGWPEVLLAKGKKLQKGDTSKLVYLLKKRLYISKDLSLAPKDSIFTGEVENAVRTFQQRHGLKEDGIAGGKTLIALNVPVEERIKQIIVNMERWRWVPQKSSGNYINVNIPEFELHVMENHKKSWSMNVIVGKTATGTPIFNDEIEYIVMSPYWNIPYSIVSNEIIPLMQKDSTYLIRNNMEVLKNKEIIDPHSISWDSLKDTDIRKYRFRQKPGYGNALGKIKFVFPNEFDVYLHDTPTGHLFSQSERDFSHGCIRIEEPLKFASYLLRDNREWTKKNIIKAMNSNQEQVVTLKNKIPVYITYFTAWVDEKGLANFRDDLYGHDQKLETVYFEK